MTTLRLSLDGQECHYCRAPATSRDHIVPRALGGSNQPWNLVPSCVRCNSEKGSSEPTCRCEKCSQAVARHAEGDRGTRRGRTEDGWISKEFASWYANFTPMGKVRSE